MQSRFRRSANAKAADWRSSKVLSQLKLLVTKHLLILAEEGDTRGGEAWHAQASKLAKDKLRTPGAVFHKCGYGCDDAVLRTPSQQFNPNLKEQ